MLTSPHRVRARPAVALTAYARDVERKAFLAAGFQVVVTKPILDHQELFAAIAPLLRSVLEPSHAAPESDPRSHNAS